MAPPTYKDFSKKATSILSDDYGVDKKFTVKTKAGGLGFKIENKLLDAGAVAGAVECKYSPCKGVSLDKIKLSPKGDMSVEGKLSEALAPGLDLFYKGSLGLKGTAGLTFKDPNINATAEVDVPALSSVHMNAVVGMDDITAGGMVKYGTKAGVTDYNIAVGYSLGKDVFASLSTEKSMSLFKAAAFWKACPPAAVGAEVKFEPEKAGAAPAVELGAVYACNPATTVRFKASSAGALAAAFAQRCGAGLTVVGAAETSMADLARVKLGASITLG